MKRYSIVGLVRNALTHHANWPQAWRSPDPKPRYDVIIIGGGGHGLATAYYLGKLHGITNVAVLEKGWLGGGNTGRNTTIVRSTYLLDDNARFYEHSLKLWEGLSRELNFNLMFSQRGVINLTHTMPERESWARRYNAMRCNGIDGVYLSRDELKERVPALDVSGGTRFPILGGFMQPRGGVARHDAVAWGFARAADSLGVDVIQNCEVTGITRKGGRVVGVETTRGRIAADKIGICVAGNTGRVAAMAGLRLPIETHLLQAMVTEPVKPFLHSEVSSAVYHTYISQTDRGEVLIGGRQDGYNTYTQRGSLPAIEDVLAAAVEQFPCLSRLRIMRIWAGITDMSMDGSPIIGKLPLKGLYLNGGWCYGGFKATPGAGWVFAHTIARDEPHPINAPFTLERFARGATISEGGRGNVPAAH